MMKMINEIIAERIEFAGQFLKKRKLDYDKIENAFGCDVHDSKYLLLTSSAVHGLANSESDVDFISINNKNFPPDRVAAQHFFDRNHVEVKPIWEEDINAALKFLESLHMKSFGEVMMVVNNWGDHFKISKKYLERTINGVDISGTCPYMYYIPFLSHVWQMSSFEMFRKCVIFCMLSERSGERFARISYGTNALLYLMDTILSLHGYVYSNKKWYLERYSIFVKAEKYSAILRELILMVNDSYNRVISFPDSNTQFSSQLYELYMQSKKLMNINLSEDNLFESESMLYSLPFLENSIIVYNEKNQKSTLIHAAEMMNWNISMDTLFSLGENEANQLLTLLRTGMLKIKLGD